MQSHVDLQEMLHQAVVIEKQLTRRSSTRTYHVSSSFTRGNLAKDDKLKMQVSNNPSNAKRIGTKPFGVKQVEKAKVETRQATSSATNVKKLATILMNVSTSAL